VPGDRVELRPGESVRIEALDLMVTFDAVLEDSRCPLEVCCIWEGDAAVRLILTADTGGSETAILHTSQAPWKADYRGATFRLEDLRPHPTTPGPLDPDQYRAVLRVVRP
jgi:hypothetical protein